MPVLIFHLKDVPEDEADDVRRVLHEASIEHYETSGGTLALTFGLAVPAIWLRHDADRVCARALIDAYQQERAERMRRERTDQGEHEGMGQRFRRRPAAVFGVLVVVAAILYFSVRPFYW